jgi:NADH-quinone oxidoreductase subunit G
LRDLAKAIAKSLKEAENPVVVCGSGSGSRGVIDAAAQVALALATDEAPANLCFSAAECNSFGLALMGAHPTSEALSKAGDVDAVVIVENDLHRRAGAEAVNRCLDDAKNVVVIDHTPHLTLEKASMVFPAGTFAEAEGTLVNNEVRAQRFFQVYVAEGDVQASWRWLQEIAQASGRSEAAALDAPDALLSAMGKAFPILSALGDKLPGANFRVQGEKVPRQSPRYSGRTAMRANISVHEPKPPEDRDSPLAFSMEGYPGRLPSALITRFWAPAWNSVQSLNKFQAEVGGALVGGDPGLRLMEPGSTGAAAFTDEIPNAFRPRKNELLLVGLHHIFGSEELSRLSPAVAERAPAPYIALNPADAKQMEIDEGASVEIEVQGSTHRHPVRLKASLARGLAGIPVGVGIPALELPAWGVCRKV